MQSKTTNQQKEIKRLDGSTVPFTHSEFVLENKKVKILILGTRVTEKSIQAGYYYFGLSNDENCFWEVLRYCFNDSDFISKDVAKVKKALASHNIVVSDLIYSCEYYGSEDNETKKDSEKPNPDLIRLIEQADLVILNGGWNKKTKTGPLNYLHDKAFPIEQYIDKRSIKNKHEISETGIININNHQARYISLYSTSGSCAKKENFDTKTDFKKDFWKKHIDEALLRIKRQ